MYQIDIQIPPGCTCSSSYSCLAQTSALTLGDYTAGSAQGLQYAAIILIKLYAYMLSGFIGLLQATVETTMSVKSEHDQMRQLRPQGQGIE